MRRLHTPQATFDGSAESSGNFKDLFPFKVKLEVRGYEIDSFQHVNNAVYLNWLGSV